MSFTKLYTPKRLSFLLLSLLLTACISPSTDKGRNLNDPKTKGIDIAIQDCSNCHGLNGQSVSAQFPKLAGQQPDYLKAQLTDFKGHTRRDVFGTQFMWGFTNLTQLQVDQLAEYFSSQPPMKGKVNSSANLKEGESIFNNGLPAQGVLACSSCHGPQALGVGEIPRLAGQHSSYLYKQIMVFKYTDDRPRGQVMKQIIHNINNEQALSVAGYLSSL